MPSFSLPRQHDDVVTRRRHAIEDSNFRRAVSNTPECPLDNDAAWVHRLAANDIVTLTRLWIMGDAEFARDVVTERDRRSRLAHQIGPGITSIRAREFLHLPDGLSAN